MQTTKGRNVLLQRCPLCGEMQEMIVNGHESHNDKGVMVDPERGYSFCNCRNIFFTDRGNLAPATYDADYYTRYNENPNISSVLSSYFKYFSHFDIKPFDKVLEIGAINSTVLNRFQEFGADTYSLDIFDHPTGTHKKLVGDFERMEFLTKFKIIWASHVFEHFIDPVGMVKKCYDLLETGGFLFVAMPDPYFIDWSNPYLWQHWHLKEHFTLWDMDSFVDVCRDKGFIELFAKHNVDTHFICIGDQHILLKKV
jgi:SAM-dependent methyltransferase